MVRASVCLFHHICHTSYLLQVSWSLIFYHHLRIALAFELLTPTRVCRLFSCALRRPVRYVYSQTIDIEVTVPNGYREQLLALETLFGKHKAPYFGLDLETGQSREVNGDSRWSGDGSGGDAGKGTVVEEARALWPGWRGIEEYAREVFVCAHHERCFAYCCSPDADEDTSPWRKLPTA